MARQPLGRDFWRSCGPTSTASTPRSKGCGHKKLLATPEDPDATVPYADILDAERQGWPDVQVRVDGKLTRLNVETLRTIVMPQKPSSEPPFVFLSYSHKDKNYRDRLLTHLKILKGDGLIRDWHDREIPAGAKWKAEIDRNLKSADIAIMLVSPDFLASDYCNGIELRQALGQEHTTVVPVIARVSSWKSGPLGELDALPIDGKPITKHGNRDEGWLAVEEGIRKVAETMRRERDSQILARSRHLPPYPR